MLSKSCLLLSNSELTDPAKNLTLRSKLAFFKKSMLLVHHPDFELAFKRSELFDMSLVKLVLYFNNKTSSSKAVSIIYSYDENYYRITVLDKLIRVD